MSEGMIGLVPLDELRGVAGDLFGKLVGSKGPVFADELKKFVLKQPCWLPTETSDQPLKSVPSAPTPPVLLPMPADGVVFEMTLDGNDPANDPLQGMVAGHGFSGKWKHKGPKVNGKQTGTFVWVTVGYQPNLKAVRTACLVKTKDKGGKIPEGQWREEVMRHYQNNGVPRGIADPSWQSPDGDVFFPCVVEDGNPDFGWAGRVRLEDWLWLVKVSK